MEQERDYSFPEIELKDAETNNPIISSPNSPFEIQFYQTKETFVDVETYKAFIDNAISRFRKSKTYKPYKGYLCELGLDHCQVHRHITSDMATIEMHHNMLTVYDIAVILTEYTLKTTGYITTFDLVNLLKREHINNRVQLVMLSLTPHQLYHNTDELFIHPDMCFGYWKEFICRYHIGITRDIAYKLRYYMQDAIKRGGTEDNGLLELYDYIIDWSE